MLSISISNKGSLRRLSVISVGQRAPGWKRAYTMNTKSGLRVVRLSYASCDLHTQHQVLKTVGCLCVCEDECFFISASRCTRILHTYFIFLVLYDTLRICTVIYSYMYSMIPFNKKFSRPPHLHNLVCYS